MNPSSSSKEHPEEGVLDQLGSTVEDLYSTIREATEIILIHKRRPIESVDLLIQEYRMHALILLEHAKKMYTEEGSNSEIIAQMEKKMGHSMQEYEFYTLMAHIFESKKTIKNFERKIHEPSLFGRIWLRLFSLFGHDRKEFLENMLDEMIIGIISDIEKLLQDPRCEKLTAEQRDIFEEGWKLWIKKAGARGINVGDNTEIGEDTISIAPQDAFNQISACQSGIDDFARNVEAVIKSITILVTEVAQDQSDAISESKCALDEADKSYLRAESLYEQAVDFMQETIFGELDEPKRNQYKDVLRTMKSDITKLHSQYRFFGGLYQIECGELELEFLWNEHDTQSEILSQMIIQGSWSKQKIKTLKQEVAHLKTRICNELDAVIQKIDFIKGKPYFMELQPERREVYHKKQVTHQNDLRQLHSN